MTINEELKNLNFHDSEFREISIQFSDGNARSCNLDIDYYNWEGNEGKPEKIPWKWKRLKLEIGHLVHFEYSAPDVLNRAQDIDNIELDFGLELFEAKAKKFATDFPKGNYPLFQENIETLSVKFNTHNWSEDSGGYIWVLGSKVTLNWIEKKLQKGQIHFPIKNA